MQDLQDFSLWGMLTVELIWREKKNKKTGGWENEEEGNMGTYNENWTSTYIQVALTAFSHSFFKACNEFRKTPLFYILWSSWFAEH